MRANPLECKTYADQVFTTSVVGWPGCQHVDGYDFSVVIEKAKALGGFEAKAGNIFDTRIEWTQGGLTYENWQPGVNYSIGVRATF